MGSRSNEWTDAHCHGKTRGHLHEHLLWRVARLGCAQGHRHPSRAAHTHSEQQVFSAANHPPAQPRELRSGLEFRQRHCLGLTPNYHQQLCAFVYSADLQKLFSNSNSSPGFASYHFFPNSSNEFCRRRNPLLCLKYKSIPMKDLKKPVWTVNPRTNTQNQTFAKTKLHFVHLIVMATIKL